MGVGIVKQIEKGTQVSHTVDELKEQVRELEERNSVMGADIESFDDASIIEQEARERLNLKREGEHVVVILPSDERDVDLDDSAILELYTQQDLHEEKDEPQLFKNAKAWLNFFFE